MTEVTKSIYSSNICKKKSTKYS